MARQVSSVNAFGEKQRLTRCGSYCPYKYDMHRFVTIGVVDKDQMDPTIYCVLTARSKLSGVAIAEFNAFIPKWEVSTNTFRPPVSSVV